MDEIEVPQYFICPISLQIMKDPVTAITGITYDRDSIEHWLFSNKNTTCPVTKQPLPRDSDLTPNHTLRRLIQAWCTQNASLGIDRIPTPKPPLNKIQVLKLLKNLTVTDPNLKLKSLRKLELLAAENERNKKCLLEAGVPKATIFFIVGCFIKGQIHEGLEEALSLLQFVKVPAEEVNLLLAENDQILDSLAWVLGCEMENSIAVKSHAVLVLKRIIQKGDPSVLERLKVEFFDKIVKILRNGVTQKGMNAALHVLLRACPWGRNRIMMVEIGAVFELVEIELMAPEKRNTELALAILFHLCSCANGRAQFLSHKGSIAMLTDRILKVSAEVDERAVFVLSLISKFSATKMVLQDMLNVGTVSKLCMLLQADHAKYLKDKAIEILKSHSEVWKNSPCFSDPSFHASLGI
ncbi:E3 ubiquitin-protein ligase PUB23-like [Gastrolobium bilobum]|uniref:E3 ubiquitin-protein ligase PUB23-like n=1 Tax=Gastrolobium bilobum TaxID=150636 RepID=UPI002AB0A363|nr:E3 ubiquitin-protein ligase PUB23-like [Gastrolobium bilobum]